MVLEPIREKALLADRPHIDQRAMDAGGQKFLAQTG
jgi:hypothetical protein